MADLDKSWLEASPAAHIPRAPVADIPHIPGGIHKEGKLDSGLGMSPETAKRNMLARRNFLHGTRLGEHSRQSTSRATKLILERISSMIRGTSGRLIVLNPSNRDEDLSERWITSPAAYREFTSGIQDLEKKWNALFQLRGIDKVARALEQLFGEEIAKRVVEKQTKDIQAAREQNQLVMKKGYGIVSGVATGAAISIPRNTFYGETK